MNIAYFRKTKKTKEEALASLKEGFAKRGIAIAAEKTLPSGSVLVQFMDEAKTAAILKEDRMLLGLIPMVAMIDMDGKQVSVGIMNPQLMQGTEHLDALEETVGDMTNDLRLLVNEVAGVGEPKISKVKLYSTATCPYCKMEKEYLEKNNVAFDLVMVDADRKAAQEMIQKSGRTGVPQTEIIYDDGDSEIVMGFDREQLAQLLMVGKA